MEDGMQVATLEDLSREGTIMHVTCVCPSIPGVDVPAVQEMRVPLSVLREWLNAPEPNPEG